MPEFRIAPDALRDRRENRIRLRMWGTVLLLIAIVAVVLGLRIQGLIGRDSKLVGLMMASLIGAVILAYIQAFREGMRRFKRRMVIVLDEKSILFKAPDLPAREIAFSEIAALVEGPSGFVVESVPPVRKIGVPDDIAGFEAIREKMARHHAFSTQPRKMPWRGLLTLLIVVLSWVALLNVQDTGLILLCAAIVLAFQALGTRTWWSAARSSPKRWLVAVALAFSSLAAIWVIYNRLTSY